MTIEHFSFEDPENMRVRDAWNALMQMLELDSKIDESRRLHVRDLAAVDVKIRAANRSRGDAQNDDIVRVNDGIWHRFDADIPGAVVGQRFIVSGADTAVPAAWAM